MVKLSDAVNASCDILKDSIKSARFEAELIAAYVLKMDRLQLLICKNDGISDEDYSKIIDFSRQRAQNVPFAYITGKKEFMSLEFEVNRNVLIPRPETEELVGLVIEMCGEKEVKILDLCTGSGAICCSIAHYLKNARCVGADISKAALETAKKNADSLGVSDRVSFCIYDVLDPKASPGIFDIVVSNPPYIETAEIDKLEDTVKNHEPRLALDGGDDGLVFYRKIIENIDLYLKKGGMLLLEIGYNQGEAVKKLLEAKFDNIRIIKDLSGHDRIAVARYI